MRIHIRPESISVRTVPIIDPTFGYTQKGGTGVSTPGNRLTATKFTCPESGQALSITVYVKQSATATPKIKCAIYLDNGAGYPGSLVGYTEEWMLTSGWDGWKTFNIVSGGALQGGNIYWLVFWATDYATFYRDAGETNQYTYVSYTYDGFPDPFPSGGSLYAYVYSIYCTYTTALPPANPIIGKPLIRPDLIGKAKFRR